MSARPAFSCSYASAAIRSILDGQIFVPPLLGRRDPGAPQRPPATIDAGDKLTLRQREVLNELLKGQASKEIARSLDIAEGTVKIHLAAIYRALGVRTRAEAIAKLKSN